MPDAAKLRPLVLVPLALLTPTVEDLRLRGVAFHRVAESDGLDLIDRALLTLGSIVFSIERGVHEPGEFGVAVFVRDDEVFSEVLEQLLQAMDLPASAVHSWWDGEQWLADWRPTKLVPRVPAAEEPRPPTTRSKI